jgi:phosphate-selective porin OprO and OprP
MKALSPLASSPTLLSFLLASLLSALGPRALAQQTDGQNSLAAQVAELAQTVRQHQTQIDEQRRLIELQAEVLQDLRRELAQARGDLQPAAGPLGPPREATWRTAALMDPTPAPSPAVVTPAAAPALGPQTPAPAASSAAGAAQLVGKAEEKPDPRAMRAYWNNGLHIDSADRNFRVTIGGRIHNDWAVFSSADRVEGALGSLRDGTEFRRTRLQVSAVMYKNVNFRAEYDFAGGSTIKDLYIGVSDLPGVGNVRVGHFKEPFTLDEPTSDNNTTFMERALPNTFAPSRNTGVMFHDALAKQRMTWQLGVFRDTNEFGDGSGDGKYNLTGRVTGRPWYQDGGRKLVHAGLGYSRRKANSGQFRFSQRPEAHLAPRFVDTGSFDGKTLQLIGTELALVNGPVSLQSEYVGAFVTRPNAGRLNFSSFYVMGSYFLTGEHRAYDNENGIFGRVSPRHNFEGVGRGRGAWEVAARYSRLNLDDEPIFGGKLQDVTLGLNWYLNPNTKIMWNYVSADRVDTGRANIFQTRFQVDF